jgi:hypothetical protein
MNLDTKHTRLQVKANASIMAIKPKDLIAGRSHKNHMVFFDLLRQKVEIRKSLWNNFHAIVKI